MARIIINLDGINEMDRQDLRNLLDNQHYDWTEE